MNQVDIYIGDYRLDLFQDEDITINLNVRIEHEIRVKVEQELDDIFSADSGLF